MKTLHYPAFKVCTALAALLFAWAIASGLPDNAWATEAAGEHTEQPPTAIEESSAEALETAASTEDVSDKPTQTDLAPAREPEGIALQAQSSPPEAPLADGDYVIRANTATQSVLDVVGGSSKSGANVQLYNYNGTAAQKWHLAYDTASGLYTITNLIADMALDVSGASTANGANVQVYKPNGTAAQQWNITKNGSGWRVQSALKTDFVLDISGGSGANGANAQGYKANNTAAQLFDFLALKPVVAASTETAAEGAYTLSIGTGKVVDVSGGSRNSSANVQQYTSNDTYAQRFYLESDGSGFYRVFNIGSGLALDVSGAGIMPGTNVHQYTSNDTAAQLWSLQSNGDGTCTLISKVNGLALDVSGGSSNNGANLQVWIPNGTKAQKFTLKTAELLSAGTATLHSAASITRVVDVKSASDQAGASLQIYDGNGTIAQRVVVSKQGGGYTLRPVCSGLYVATSGTTVVQSATAATWKASYAKTGKRRGVVFTDADGKALTTSGSANASTLKLAANSSSASQVFCPATTDLIGTGIYTIASTNGGRVLDVAGGSWKDSANIQIYTANNTGAQAFKIESAGGGYYRITNAMTGKVLDVAGGKTADGTNVQQYKSNGTGAQLWKAEMAADGSIVFTNKVSGKVLNVADGKNADGANVNIWTKSTAKAPGWRVKGSSFQYDSVLQNAYNLVQSRSSATGYYIMVDRGGTRTMVFEGSQGNWTPVKNYLVSVGAPSSATPTGYYSISGRGYSFDGALGGTPYTCYYWTNFLDGIYLFHSVPYNQGTWTVQDDRLGGQISHGCVRMATDEAKWIYDTIPNGTRVYIYN